MQGPPIGSLQGSLRLVTHMEVCVLSPSQIYFSLLHIYSFAHAFAHALQQWLLMLMHIPLHSPHTKRMRGAT